MAFLYNLFMDNVMVKFSCLGFALSLVTLVMAHNAFSSPLPVDFSNESEMVGFYTSGQYSIEVPKFSAISAKYKHEKQDKELTLFSLKEENTELKLNDKDQFRKGYNPVYNRNYTGFSGAIGYSGGGLRIELEGAFTKFDVDKQKYKFQDNYRYFALSKDEEISGQPDKPTPTPPEPAPQPQPQPQPSPKTTTGYNYVTAKNEGLSIISLTLNACYDVIIGNSQLIPSVCIGIGQGITNFLGVINIKTIYKAKVGVGFLLSPKTIIFVNGYYVKVPNDSFKNVSIQYQHELEKDPKHIEPIIFFNSDYYGGEVGLRFIL
ncbi:P44/Msp2 family outer membrane protein [Ehrlichia ruminantium]|nr:P44/Msp2 family outer membrane protein [Ehrlichia ruminantium]QLK54620.1 P44/Msp2 family outer membrane protein [Ehrlichia ruminantium]QLK57369.1 P44/Msp2 family outer membrane protein [Ehrlichia ruminantium]